MSHLQDPQIEQHIAAALEIGSMPYNRRMVVTGNTGAAKEVIRDQHRTARQPWISNATMQIINQHHEAQIARQF